MENVTTKAVELFKEKGVSVDTKNGVRITLSQGDAEKFYADNGITKAVLTAMKDAESALINGAAQHGANALADLIEIYKREGKPLDSINSEVTIKSSMGPTKVIIHGISSHNNPESGTKITKYGRVQLKVSRKRNLDKDMITDISSQIENSMK